MMMRLPNRRARCPSCGRTVSAYVPTAHVEALDGPRCYIFRSHLDLRGDTCAGWASRVPDDAFLDGQPNLP